MKDRFDEITLKAQELYAIVSEDTKEYTLISEIIKHKDDIIYDVALTNQSYIGKKLNMSQSQMSLFIKILKVL